MNSQKAQIKWENALNVIIQQQIGFKVQLVKHPTPSFSPFFHMTYVHSFAHHKHQNTEKRKDTYQGNTFEFKFYFESPRSEKFNPPVYQMPETNNIPLE